MARRVRLAVRSHVPAGWPERLVVKATKVGRILAGREVLTTRDVRRKYLLLGNPGAQFGVIPDLITPESIVYSAGIGKEVSFDLELINRFGVTVEAFDPTPRSLAWLAKQSLPSSFRVHKYGFADSDGEAEFAEPAEEADDSYSTIRRPGMDNSRRGRLRRLGDAMTELGHSTLDLLKLDIEGSEYGVIEDIVTGGIRIKQLCVEFHHRWPEVGVDKTRLAVRSLRSAGFRIFYISPSGEEYGFLGPVGK